MKTPIPETNPSRQWPRAIFRQACGLLSLPLLAALAATQASAYTVPQTGNLLFGCNTDDLPASGNTGNWTTGSYPTGGSLTVNGGNPLVETINGVKWENNLYSAGNGYNFADPAVPGGSYTAAIPATGLSMVMAVKPKCTGIGLDWTSCVDIFHGQWVLGFVNGDGRVRVHRKGTRYYSAVGAVPYSQNTILSLVINPDGTFKVRANGTEIMNVTDTNAFTELTPGGNAHEKYVRLGRGTDGWAVFNGNIGDTYVWKSVLTPTEISVLETELMTKFHAGAGFPGPSTITVSAVGGGTISPSGPAVSVPYEGSQTFNIASPYGYVLNNVVVDTVPQGPITSYTFTNVTANHSIEVSWTSLPTISGTVVGPTSDPVYSAFVSLSTNPDGSSPTLTRPTDSLGNYALVVPGDATYYLVARKGGMVTSAPQMVVISGSSEINKNFMLDASAGLDPLVVLDASSLTPGALTSWPNAGTVGGTFNSIDGSHTPTVDSSYGIQAVKFAQDASDANRQTLAGSIPTPPQITGSSDWSISTKLYKLDANQNSDNFYMSWAGGDWGCYNTAAFAYRNDGYALTHWCWDIWFNGGAPIQGTWHVVTVTYDGNAEKIYVDGVLNRTDYPGALSIHDAGLMLVGGRTWHDVRDQEQYWRFNGAIANLQIFDQALSATQVAQVVDQQNGAIVRTVSGTISDAGGPVTGASVSLKNGAVVVAGPFTTLAGGTYSLSSAFADGDTCTVSASKEGDLPGTIPVLIATGINSYPNSDILLAPDPNADVLFSLNTDSLSGIADGARITSWSCAVPVGASMPAFNTWNNGLPELGPIVETLGGVKWEQNTRAVYSEVPPPTVHTRQDGFQLGGDYTTPIAVNGVTVVTTVRPVRKAISDPWTSIVDVFYRNLILGIRNDNGELLVVRNNTTFTGPAIPDGQKTILALVMQSDGQFKVYANGAEVMNETSTSPMTALTPGSAGHEKRIRVGRGWDDWTVFNGNIADTVVYKSAISDGQRTALEASLATKFGITLPSGGNDYADWAIANAPGQTPGEDYNNDGVQNGIAYFMGATGPVTNPGLTGSNTVTWPMSATFSGTWQVQTSSNLATWTPADPQPVPAGGNLAYTLPSGPDKLFVRLVVTPN